jgi:hypothetical protein
MLKSTPQLVVEDGDKSENGRVIFIGICRMVVARD